MERGGLQALSNSIETLSSGMNELVGRLAPLVRTRIAGRVRRELQVMPGPVAKADSIASLELMGGDAIAPYVVDMSGEEVFGAVVLEVQLVQKLVGLMLGEDPSTEPDPFPRPLTPIDLELARRVCLDVLDSLRRAAGPEAPRFGMGSVGTGETFQAALPVGPSTLVATLEIGPGEEPYGRVIVLIPAGGAGAMVSPTEVPEAAPKRKSGVAGVLPMLVDVTAELARVRLSLQRFRELKVGDSLDLGAGRTVELRVGGKPVMTGMAGDVAGVRGVKIQSRCS